MSTHTVIGNEITTRKETLDRQRDRYWSRMALASLFLVVGIVSLGYIGASNLYQVAELRRLSAEEYLLLGAFTILFLAISSALTRRAKKFALNNDEKTFLKVYECLLDMQSSLSASSEYLAKYHKERAAKTLRRAIAMIEEKWKMRNPRMAENELGSSIDQFVKNLKRRMAGSAESSGELGKVFEVVQDMARLLMKPSFSNLQAVNRKIEADLREVQPKQTLAERFWRTAGPYIRDAIKFLFSLGAGYGIVFIIARFVFRLDLTFFATPMLTAGATLTAAIFLWLRGK